MRIIRKLKPLDQVLKECDEYKKIHGGTDVFYNKDENKYKFHINTNMEKYFDRNIEVEQMRHVKPNYYTHTLVTDKDFNWSFYELWFDTDEFLSEDEFKI